MKDFFPNLRMVLHVSEAIETILSFGVRTRRHFVSYMFQSSRGMVNGYAKAQQILCLRFLKYTGSTPTNYIW